jgi:hypothetical protein
MTWNVDGAKDSGLAGFVGSQNDDQRGFLGIGKLDGVRAVVALEIMKSQSFENHGRGRLVDFPEEFGFQIQGKELENLGLVFQ